MNMDNAQQAAAGVHVHARLQSHCHSGHSGEVPDHQSYCVSEDLLVESVETCFIQHASFVAVVKSHISIAQ